MILFFLLGYRDICPRFASLYILIIHDYHLSVFIVCGSADCANHRHTRSKRFKIKVYCTRYEVLLLSSLLAVFLIFMTAIMDIENVSSHSCARARSSMFWQPSVSIYVTSVDWTYHYHYHHLSYFFNVCVCGSFAIE